MAYQGSITLVDLSDGQSGSSGINTATVYLYQRATTTPSGPNGTLRYTFSTHTLSGAYFNGWEQSIDDLSGSNPIWIIAATATASADVGYDDIPMGEWSNPIEIAQNGQDGQDGQDGAPGQPGQDGAPGTNGINTATIYIYKRINSTPSTPADATYTFVDGSFTIPTGWSRQVPTSDGNPCYVCSAVAIGNQATATLEWSTPVILVEDGTDGENGISPTVESISNGVKITDAEGNITYIYDGISGTSYYTHVRYSANADGHDYVSVPTSSTIYIGVYSGTSNVAPAYNDSGWTWSKYVGNPGTPGAAGVSVTEVKEVYYITSGTAPTQSTLPNGTPITSTSTGSNIWTTVIPAYIANGRYYTSLQTSLSSGTSPVFSTIVLNQGLTDANANAAEANAATALLGGHFIYKSTASSSGQTPASANVVQTIKDNNIDVTDDPTKWGYNTHIGANGIKLRYNENDLSSWTSQGISIYNPITHNVAMQLTGQALNFYNPNNNRLSLSLNSNGLNFYGSSIVTPDASLTTMGLVLSKGGIQTGTSGQNGFVYLSSEDYQRKDATHSGTTINGHTPTAAGTDGKIIDDPAWREIIGTKFGVDSEGNLYANNANLNNATVEGAITATSLTIDSGNSSYSGVAAINATNYDIEIVNDINSLPEGYTANNNNTYLYPIIYHNGVNVRDEFIDSPDTTINSNKIYYTRALVDGAYVYTRVDSPVVADINSYYERVYPFNKFIWYEGNNAIGAAGDVYNGGIVVEYGKIYRVVYSFSDDEVGEAQTTQTIYIDDTKYITKISDTGITIHPENSSGNNYLQITSSDVEIIKNGESLAQFGANGSRIGAYNAGRIVTSPNELAGYMTNGVRYFTMLENGGEVETYTYMAIWESDIDNSVTIDLSTDQRTRYYWSTVNASEGAIPITFVYHFTNGDPMNGRTRIFNLSITKGTATSNSHFTYDGVNTLTILSYKPTVTNPGQWTWTLYGKEISANHITNTTGPFFQFGTDEEELTHTAAYSMSIGKSVSTGPYGLAVGKYNEYHEHDAFSIGGGSNSTYGRYTVFAVDSGGGISAPAYVGLITLVASSTEIPNGWLRCDGDTWEITRYPELYDMIGTNFGTASSGYFKVPTLTAPSGMTYLIYTGRSQTHTIDGVIQS